MECLTEIVENKKVLFITTKNIDYIRNTQELRLIKEVANGVEIVCSQKKNYFIRILDVWRKITKRKVKENDIVFVGFEPQFVVPFVGWKFRKKTLIIDFFISVYDTLICDRKIFKYGGLIAKFSHWMDVKTIQRAEHVISDTKAHAEYFEKEFGLEIYKNETIYLEADESIYYPRQQNKPEELKNKYVVLYFGSVLPLQGIEVVLDAVRELKDDNDIYFDIIGPIPDKYNKPIQINVGYTNWVSQQELAERIANADLCLAGHFSGIIDKSWRTIPGKAYIYEKMGKKMILGDGCANHELYIEDENHIFVKMGNYIELADKVRRTCTELNGGFLDCKRS